jgi:hypothetical protein
VYNFLYNFAQAYGEGSYGESLYSCTAQQQANGECSTAASGSGSAGSGGNGSLADTGLIIVAVATLACLLIFTALVVRIWRRPKVAAATASTAAPATPQDTVS